MSHYHRGERDCADFIESIVFLLDNELDAADVAAVRAHLEECSPCLDRYDVQRTIKSVVARSCSETAPDALRERVLLSIQHLEIHIRTTE